MSHTLFETVVVPIADPDDAAATCRALQPYLEEGARVNVVHVIEKAGGAPDKASVEQREEYAEGIFERVQGYFADGAVSVETEILFGTDVAEAILSYAAEVDASAVAFTPRGVSRWVQLLTGDVARSLIGETDRPVVVLPEPA